MAGRYGRYGRYGRLLPVSPPSRSTAVAAAEQRGGVGGPVPWR